MGGARTLRPVAASVDDEPVTAHITPKGLVGIIANDSARYSLFTSCVLKMQERMLEERVQVKTEMLIGGDWCGARNRLAELTLQTVVAIRDKVISAYQDIMKMPI